MDTLVVYATGQFAFDMLCQVLVQHGVVLQYPVSHCADTDVYVITVAENPCAGLKDMYVQDNCLRSKHQDLQILRSYVELQQFFKPQQFDYVFIDRAMLDYCQGVPALKPSERIYH